MAFKPEAPPLGVDVEHLADYTYRELARIAENLALIEQGRWLPILYAAPTKPREGMLAIADGTSWNPGLTGKGLYEYRSGAWAKL